MRRTIAFALIVEVVRTNPGYRAVSAIPGLRDGRPVVEVVLVNGSDWRTVFGNLDWGFAGGSASEEDPALS